MMALLYMKSSPTDASESKTEKIARLRSILDKEVNAIFRTRDKI